MQSKRIRFPVAVALMVAILVLAVTAAGAAAGSLIKPIETHWGPVWPLHVEEWHDHGQQCQAHVVATWVFDEGNLQGVIAEGTYDPLVHHPCDDTPPGTYSENAKFFGTFEGTLDGLRGGFDLAGQARMNEKDGILHFELIIVPGSGTGELAGIHGVLKGDSPWYPPWRPLTGWYRLQ